MTDEFEIEEFDDDLEEVACWNEDFIVCPYCKEKYQPETDEEIPDEDWAKYTEKCRSCGKEFAVKFERICMNNFQTYKIKHKEAR